jgi:hypothetical protein
VTLAPSAEDPHPAPDHLVARPVVCGDPCRFCHSHSLIPARNRCPRLRLGIRTTVIHPRRPPRPIRCRKPRNSKLPVTAGPFRPHATPNGTRRVFSGASSSPNLAIRCVLEQHDEVVHVPQQLRIPAQPRPDDLRTPQIEDIVQVRVPRKVGSRSCRTSAAGVTTPPWHAYREAIPAWAEEGRPISRIGFGALTAVHVGVRLSPPSYRPGSATAARGATAAAAPRPGASRVWAATAATRATAAALPNAPDRPRALPTQPATAGPPNIPMA